MRPLPFTEVPAEFIFGTALVVLAVLQIAAGRSTFRGFFRRGSGSHFDRGSLAVVLVTSWIGLFGCIVLSIKAPWATIAAGNAVIRYVVFAVGIALILGGGILREWAVATLGKSFTLDVRIESDQTVITGGPYRWMRHPSYTGLLVAYAGLALSLGNWLSVIVVIIVPTAGLVWRIHVEEGALVRELGEPYVEYAATHKRLLPGIW